MSIKTKALRYALRLAKKRKGLKIKKIKTETLQQYIHESGQKRKITDIAKAANKRRHKQSTKSLNVYNVHTTKSIKSPRKQKPKTGGGRQVLTAKGSSYGIGAREHEITSPVLKVAVRRGSFKGARTLGESWYSEMKRMYGGVHMAQDTKSIKKSVNLLTKKKHFKIKKVAQGGEVVICRNVDRSLL